MLCSHRSQECFMNMHFFAFFFFFSLPTGPGALCEMPSFQGRSKLCGKVSRRPTRCQQLHLQVCRSQQRMSSLPCQLHPRVSPVSTRTSRRDGFKRSLCDKRKGILDCLHKIVLPTSFKISLMNREKKKRIRGVHCHSPLLTSHSSLNVIFNDKVWKDIISYSAPQGIYVTPLCVISPLLSDSLQPAWA